MSFCKKIIIFITIVFMVSCTSCSEKQEIMEKFSPPNNEIEKGYSQYIDGMFGFCVTFPVVWASETLSYRYASEEHNASPDCGINFYIDNNKANYIYVYGNHGKITTRYVEESNYEKTAIDDKGVLYTKKFEDVIEAQFFLNENSHISAQINMNYDLYMSSKNEIYKMLKSIIVY